MAEIIIFSLVKEKERLQCGKRAVSKKVYYALPYWQMLIYIDCCRGAGGLVPVSWLGVPPRGKATQALISTKDPSADKRKNTCLTKFNTLKLSLSCYLQVTILKHKFHSFKITWTWKFQGCHFINRTWFSCMFLYKYFFLDNCKL